MAAERHDQFALRLRVQALGRGARRQQPGMQGRIFRGQGIEEQPVQADQPVPGGKVGEGQAESQGRRIMRSSGLGGQVLGRHRDRSSSAVNKKECCAE